jgi:hypothetical protein
MMMTTSGPMSPAHGDVVIGRDAEGGRLYTISVMPGNPQVRYPTFEKAVAVATAWALREHVSIWCTEDGKTFTALEPAHHRVPASTTPNTPRSEK